MSMDILKMIKKDHKEAKALLKKLEASAEKPTKQTASLASQFVLEMKLHAKSEEHALYEACKKKNVKLKETAQEGYNEHECLDLMLDKILVTKPGEDGELAAVLSVVKELIQHHATEEEEQEMFPKIKKAFSKEELSEMGELMQAKKDEIKPSLKAQVMGVPSQSVKSRKSEVELQEASA
jgi:hemerythrin superfamily protein